MFVAHQAKMFHITVCAGSACVLYNIMVQSFFMDNSGPEDTAPDFGMVNILSLCSTERFASVDL